MATRTAPAQESAPIVIGASRGRHIGNHNDSEFGAGPLTISPLTGSTRNPWNLEKNSGGSSGGAAASVAAGMGHAALATDAGGSIRIPSGLCGVVGMKATAGRVATYPPNVAGALSSPGPIARTVEDVALLMSVLTAPDERDVDQLPGSAIKLNESLDDGVSDPDRRVHHTGLCAERPPGNFRRNHESGAPLNHFGGGSKPPPTSAIRSTSS